MRARRLAAVATAALILTVGCSGSAVDASCDVTGITGEVEHMVGESGMELTSLGSLTCSGGWALATVTVSEEGASDSTSTFLFEQTDSGWFLRAPEIACAGDAGLPSVPDELKEDACRGM